MSDGSDSLNRRQEQAILALLRKPTLKGAARAAGVGERTLRGWLKLPAFAAAYREARAQALQGAVGRLHGGMNKAVTTLLRNLSATKNSDQIRSALGILAMGFLGADKTDILERLALLESRAPPSKR